MTLDTRLPEPIAAALKRETAGEIVRWSGQPNARLMFLKSLPAWLMGVPWTAFSGVMFGVLALAATSGKPPISTIAAWQIAAMGAAMLFVGLFVLIGLAMLAAPFWSWWQGARTVYAITERRLVTLRVGQAVTVTSIVAREILKIERHERRDGTGTLKITTGIGRDSDGDPYEKSEELIGVPDVARAARLLDELKATLPT